MKRTVKMICMLGAAGVLLGAYFLAGSMTKKADVSEEEGTFALTDKAASDITELAWTAGGTSFDFSRTDDAWTNNADAEFPVNGDELNTLAETIASLSASRKLENVENLSDYGLDEPAFSVTVTWSDGSKTTYGVGSETAFGDGSYLSAGEDGIAYIVSDSPESAFSVTNADLAQKEEIPQVSDATRLTVGSALNAVYRAESTTIDPDQHWYDTNTEDALDADGVAELVTEAQGIAWQDLVNVNATDDELAAYGLDVASIVNIGLANDNGDSMEVWVGGMNDDGDYYARLPESNMVYTLASGSIEILLDADETELADKQVMHVEPEELKSAVLTDGTKRYEFVCGTGEETAAAGETAAAEAAAAETDAASETAADGTDAATEAAAAETDAASETAADGTDAAVETAASETAASESSESSDASAADSEADAETDTLTVTLNGTTVDAAAFRTFWSPVSTLSYTARTDDTPSGDPLLTVSCENTSGVTETLSFYACSADDYICTDQNGKSVLVSADEVDRIRRTLSQYAAK